MRRLPTSRNTRKKGGRNSKIYNRSQSIGACRTFALRYGQWLAALFFVYGADFGFDSKMIDRVSMPSTWKTSSLILNF